MLVESLPGSYCDISTFIECINMDTELSSTVKADLLSIGSVQIDPSLFPAQLTSLATAGPELGGVFNLFQVRRPTGTPYD